MVGLSFRFTLTLFLTGIAAVFLAAILVFGGILPPFFEKQDDDAGFSEPGIDLRIVGFSDLEGWRQENPEIAFQAFLSSCEKFNALSANVPANPSENLGLRFVGASIGGDAVQWQAVCAEADRVSAAHLTNPEARPGALRQFFETQFVPLQIINRRDPLPDGPAKNARPRLEETGVFTGYYEPTYKASLVKTDAYSAPVYARPEDLIEIDLGAFREELAGERIAGRVEGAKFVPYPDHQKINEGALLRVAKQIAWLDPNDLFFLQIQGSGKLSFEDGSLLRVGYSGQNGRSYTAIGRVMVEQGIMPLERVSMQSIRQWLGSAAADEAQAMREENESYVFFKALDNLSDASGPLGAQGVALTAERSLAVDRRYHTLGAPVWVDIDPIPGNGPQRIQQLMIAQDTGGAIRGPVRGDIFWGSSDQAEQIAGQMNAQGRMYVFVPHATVERLSAILKK